MVFVLSSCHNTIVHKWQMYFQASEYKERNFLDLNNNNNHHIHPIYTKDRAWLKHFGLSNSVCAQITRLITNHALSVNTDLGSFLKNPLCVHAEIILSRQGGTFYLSVHSTRSLGIQRGNPLKTFSLFRVQS